MNMLKVILFFGLVAFSNAAWNKISFHPICFEARGDKPGIFQHYGASKVIKGLQLKYLSGQVRCESKVMYTSRWGCYRHASFNGFHLNVVVTDFFNNVIFPKKQYIKNAGLWYWLPGVDEKHSNEIVFTDFATPFYLPQGGFLKIWYGEDLMNWKEGDNQGRVCVDIYALFAE